MLTKTKKITLLTTGLAGTLLATTIGGIALSSCTYDATNQSNTVDPDKNIYTTEIDWSNLEDVGKRLNIDENGLVYSDVNRTVLIGSVPNLSVSELVIPSTVREISGYIDKTPTDSGITGSVGATNSTQKGAFEGQLNLTSIKFQGQTQIINNQAFKGCTSLINVNLPSSVIAIGNSAFENTGNLSKINLNSVKFIGDSAFKGAFTNLPVKTVDISLDNAQYIGSMAFMDNTAIKSLNFSNNKTLTTLSTSAFENTAIPGIVDLSRTTLLKSIGAKAFKGTTELETVKLPSSLVTLGSTGQNGVFQNSSISSIDLSKTSITNIYQDTFNGASNLSSYSLPETLTSLDISAFTNTAITSLDLSNSQITTLGNNSFQNIPNLTEVKFPATLTTIGNFAFAGTSLTAVDLANTKLTSIGTSAFSGLANLSSVTLPTTLTTIGASAFKDTAITSIDLSSTQVRTIGNSAFENSQLSSIQFPDGTNLLQTNGTPYVSTIGQAAFKNTQLTNIDLRHVNLSTLSNSIFEDCSNLEYVLVKSPDLTSLSSPTTATAIQKQITSIGSAAFKNAKKLKGIFHVTADNDTTDQWTPNGIIVASPYLQSIGTQAFYNVPEIKVFDASNVISPSNQESFIPEYLFKKDDNLVDENGTAIESKLEAVILPSVLDDTTSTLKYFIGRQAFSNNPKLKSVGTKQTLNFKESTTKVDNYLAQIQNPGFIAPTTLKIIGNKAFSNTGIETIDFSNVTTPYDNSANFGGGNSHFMDMTSLKKAILPTWLKNIKTQTFLNTPALEQVNFDQLTSLNQMGTNNFTTLQNFKSSSVTNDANGGTSRSKRSLKADPAPVLDLSNTQLTDLPANSFTNLPSTLSAVKLPTTITGASFATGTDRLTTSTTSGDTTTQTKIGLDKIKFASVDGQDASLNSYEGLMVNSTSNATQNAGLFVNQNMDLSMFKTLTTISGSTFNNVQLTSLKLPAKATTWQIASASGANATLNTNYTTASFNGQNKLSVVEFGGFGWNSTDSTGTGENIEPFESNQWDTNIKSNTQLWSTITTMMNSLGYDATLETASSPKIGVQNNWVAPSSSPSVTAGSAGWIDEDVTQTHLINNADNKWWSNKDNVGSTDTSKAADKNLSTAPTFSGSTTSESIYFKHNGIIWTWTTTQTTVSGTNKLTITLTPDETTLPNVYKAVKDDSNAFITTFRTQKFASTTKATADAKFGLNFKFNIAVTATKN